MKKFSEKLWERQIILALKILHEKMQVSGRQIISSKKFSARKLLVVRSGKFEF